MHNVALSSLFDDFGGAGQDTAAMLFVQADKNSSKSCQGVGCGFFGVEGRGVSCLLRDHLSHFLIFSFSHSNSGPQSRPTSIVSAASRLSDIEYKYKVGVRRTTYDVLHYVKKRQKEEASEKMRN